MPISFQYPNSPYNVPTNVFFDISLVILSGPIPPNSTFHINPPILPNGLQLDSTNGRIHGNTNFSSISPSTLYTVDISYQGVSIPRPATDLILGVNFVPVFSYPLSPYLLQLNMPTVIIPFYLISNLSSITYSFIAPTIALPSGLNLNTSTGLISGTPDISTNTFMPYYIRANNDGVIYDTSLNISVQPLPSVTYPQTTYILTQGVLYNITPVDQGESLNVTYSIDGCPLPLGLDFNTQTGQIYGTPRLTTTFRAYTVTITNIIGSTSTNITLNVIKVFLAPPVISDSFTGGYCLTDPDISMRRKAEIFKYKKNSACLTKNQMLSLAVQGKGPYARRVWANQNDLGSNPNISGLPTEGNTIICNSNNNCSLTSSCDVPGPVIQLCYNPNTPLMGYVAPNRVKTNIGFKWPQRSWQPGDMGFPVGKAGNG